MDNFGYQAGMLLDEDIVCLAPGLRYRGITLYDSANGASHRLSSLASMVISLIRLPVSWQNLRAKLNMKHFPAEIIRCIFNFLDDIGGLLVTRKISNKIRNQYYRIWMRLHGLTLDQPARRFDGNLTGGIRAVAVSTKGLISLICIAIFFGYGASMPLDVLFKVAFIFYVCLLVSTVGHEYVHLWVWQIFNGKKIEHKQSTRPAYLQRGVRIGLLHCEQDIRQETNSALLGPLCGAFIALVFSILSLHEYLWYSWIIATTVAVFHLLSWLPFYGDGKVIWSQSTLRRRRENGPTTTKN